MLKSLIVFTSLAALGSALPLAGNSNSISNQSTDAAMPVEANAVCYYPAGAACPTTTQKLTGDPDDGKRTGVVVYNKDSVDHCYFIYTNNCDCIPVKYITIPANDHRFVALGVGFQGRMTRGTAAANLNGLTHKLGTWMEFSWDADGTGWADVSLIKGCDGAVSVKALDGIGVTTGFTDDVLDGAPAGAYKQKSTGAKAIMETEVVDDYTQINTIPRDWLAGKLGYGKAYIDDHHGNPDICSVNGRFAIDFWSGHY